MSTLSIPTQRTSELDDRFDALARTALNGRDDAAVEFETVFDMDYGQGSTEPMPAPAARRTPPPPAPRAVRLTRRGRTLLTLVFLGIALTLMLTMGGWATATLTGGNPEPVRVVEVQPGDTLYGIASELAEPGEIRAMVHRIQELNSLPGGQIEEGQKLAVPQG